MVAAEGLDDLGRAEEGRGIVGVVADEVLCPKFLPGLGQGKGPVRVALDLVLEVMGVVQQSLTHIQVGLTGNGLPDAAHPHGNEHQGRHGGNVSGAAREILAALR